MIRLMLKNYRCFSDQHPLVVDIAPGFTAFVGPNNSGKSAFLRFLFEYQVLWRHLSSAGHIVPFSRPEHQNNNLSVGPLRGVVDVEEVICDFTKRPLNIFFSQLEPGPGPYLESFTVRAIGNPDNLRGGEVKLQPLSRLLEAPGNNELINDQGQQVSWSSFVEAFSALQSVMFAPAFRNAINEGSGSYFELAVGTGVVATWNQWKAGTNRSAKLAIQKITEDIRHIFGFRTLEINSSADQKTFEVVVDGRPFRLNDLGAGLSQFIILFVNVAVKKPALLLLDEPELNLHPRLQVDFLTALASYTTTGSVMFATHSLGLARAVADRIYTFSPTPTGTAVSPFERTPNYAQFAGEMGFGGYQELGFSVILMVEGPSEIKTVQQFLRILGHDHDVVLLHLGGSSMIAPDRDIELAELRRVASHVAVLIDSEKSSADSPVAQDRSTFIADCRKLGFLAHVTDLRALENYFPERAVRTVKGGKYKALGPYQLLKDADLGWGKHENWRIARAMTKEELEATDIGKFLRQLIDTAVAKRN